MTVIFILAKCTYNKSDKKGVLNTIERDQDNMSLTGSFNWKLPNTFFISQ